MKLNISQLTIMHHKTFLQNNRQDNLYSWFLCQFLYLSVLIPTTPYTFLPTILSQIFFTIFPITHHTLTITLNQLTPLPNIHPPAESVQTRTTRSRVAWVTQWAVGPWTSPLTRLKPPLCTLDTTNTHPTNWCNMN